MFSRQYHASRNYLPTTALLVAVTFSAMLMASLATSPRVAASGTADLALSIQPASGKLKRGETITLSVTVTNLGPDTATNVSLGAGTSDALALLSITCPEGPAAGGFCTATTLASGERLTATVVVGTASGELDRTGWVVGSAAADATSVDSVSTNNSAEASIRIVGKRH